MPINATTHEFKISPHNLNDSSENEGDININTENALLPDTSQVKKLLQAEELSNLYNNTTRKTNINKYSLFESKSLKNIMQEINYKTAMSDSTDLKFLQDYQVLLETPEDTSETEWIFSLIKIDEICYLILTVLGKFNS